MLPSGAQVSPWQTHPVIRIYSCYFSYKRTVVDMKGKYACLFHALWNQFCKKIQRVLTGNLISLTCHEGMKSWTVTDCDNCPLKRLSWNISMNLHGKKVQTLQLHLVFIIVGLLHFVWGLSQNECKASCAGSKFSHSFHFPALTKCAVVCFYECKRPALPQHCWDFLVGGQKKGKYWISFFFFFKGLNK